MVAICIHHVHDQYPTTSVFQNNKISSPSKDQYKTFGQVGHELTMNLKDYLVFIDLIRLLARNTDVLDRKSTPLLFTYVVTH